MSKNLYRVDYSLTHDIDYFFRIDDVAFHVASNGGIIPDFIDRKTNYRIQTAVYTMKEFLEPVIIPYQPFLSDYKVTPDIFETYVDSFSRMARKGFISLDRIGAMYNPHNQDLLTIAWPSTNDNTLGQSGLLGVLPNLRDSSPTNEINTFIHMIDSQIGNYFPDYAVVKA